MNPFSFKSLYVRILLTTFLLTLGTTILTTLIFINHDTLASDKIITLFNSLTKHVVGIDSALVNNKSSLALTNLNELKTNPNILNAELYTFNGKTYSAFPADSSNTTALPQLINNSGNPQFHVNFLRNKFDMVHPILRHGKPIAALYVNASTDNGYISGIIEALLVLVILVFVITIFLQRILTQPLKALITTMKNVTIKNDFSLRVVKQHNDDIGELVDAFNTILETIQENENLQRASQEQIKKLALYDSLTRLPNKEFYKELLQKALFDTASANQQLAVLYISIDDFKFLSDSMGFVKADSLLIKIAETLQRNLRTNELVTTDLHDSIFNLARVNQDTFVTTLINTTPELVTKIALRLLNTINKSYQIDNQKVSITASIGISMAPEHGLDTDDLLNAAGIALTFAKMDGKAQIRIFNNDMNQSLHNRLWIESDLHHALEKGEFFLQYQPKYNLKKKLITGFEALLRWNHPEKGVILPEQFIHVAEHSGIITTIGTWLIRQVCKECKIWHSLGFQDLHVAFNVSARQIEDPLLVEKIKLALDEFKLPPQYLEIELTESIFLLHDDKTLATLRALKNLGVKISLDDFGTGYSSLRYLTQYPIDKLKVDKLFVKYLAESETNTIITRTIIDLAHNLNLTVIAEGVETEQQLEFLRSKGCDEVQGYLLSPPVTSAELKKLLHSYEGVTLTQ